MEENINVIETTFGPKKYLTLRRLIDLDQVNNGPVYEQACSKLNEYAQEKKLKISGHWSILYFSLDESEKKAEIGISLPVENIDSLDNTEFSLIGIPKTLAAMSILVGSYEEVSKIHQILSKHVSGKNLNTSSAVLAIEEYVVNSMVNPDPEYWITNIYHLYNS